VIHALRTRTSLCFPGATDVRPATALPEPSSTAVAAQRRGSADADWVMRIGPDERFTANRRRRPALFKTAEPQLTKHAQAATPVNS
jgi:hypothetical protein